MTKETKPTEEASEQSAAAVDAPVPAVPADDAPVTDADAQSDAEAPAADTSPSAEASPIDPPAAEASAAEAPREVRRPKKRLPRPLRRQRPAVRREKPASRRPIVRLPKPEGERGRTQERRGVVVSSAMDKTIVVKVDTIKAHRRYKKVVRRSSKYHAHDEQNAAKVGDLVRIVETRPLSKTKTWRLAEIVEAAR